MELAAFTLSNRALIRKGSVMGKSGKKMLPNGRSKGEPRHVRHYHWQTSCAAWHSLSMTARNLEMELKIIFNGVNNGDLFLSVREAAKRLGVADGTAVKAFRELQEKGFIKPKCKGSFGRKVRHATAWILTEFEFNGQLAGRDFMRWRPEEKNKTTVSKNNTTASNSDTAAQNLTPRKDLTVSENNTVLQEWGV